jgi:hypothetical protein
VRERNVVKAGAPVDRPLAPCLACRIGR